MSKYIGDKRFYGMVCKIALPIIVQNAITNFVSLLDNIMVGQIGTEQMSGVSIVNQLLFVFSLAVFGAISGPGIFTAQYVGSKNDDGVRYTVRFKLILSSVIAIVGILILWFGRDILISLFLHDTGDGLNLEATLGYAKEYLAIMLIGLLPFAITQSYAGTLRESGETIVPMLAGLVAVVVNLLFNYILIFGHWGLPAMGAAGAAIATVISRFVETLIVILWTHLNPQRNGFAKGLYKGFSIPRDLLGRIIVKGTPLFFNELMWSMGMTALTQCYSTRGLEVVAAFNISNVIVNLFNVALISMGNVVAIIIGQILGTGKIDKAIDTDRKLIAASVMLSTFMGVLLIAFAPLFPGFYQTSESIKALAVKLMRTAALFMPVSAFLNAAYFTIRSGGKTFITFLFDSVYLWVICWPVGMVLSRFTDITIVPMYCIILSLDIIKLITGYVLLKKKIWINTLVASDETA